MSKISPLHSGRRKHDRADHDEEEGPFSNYSSSDPLPMNVECGTGRCSECGVATHRVVNSGVHGRKREVLPLMTASGGTHLGRCLRCSGGGGSPVKARANTVSPRSALDVSEFDDDDTGVPGNNKPKSASPTKLFNISQSTIYSNGEQSDDDSNNSADAGLFVSAAKSPMAPLFERSLDDESSSKSYVLKRDSIAKFDITSESIDDDEANKNARDSSTDSSDSPMAKILDDIDALRNPNTTESDARKSCSALRRVAVANRHVIAAYGGIRSIVHTMKRHEQSVKVQIAACGALQNLACTTETDLLVFTEGGIRAIVRAMYHHKTSSELQGCGAAALRNLALHCAKNRDAMREEGALIALVKAMQDHPRVERVQETCCAALANACIKNAKNRGAIGELGGVKAVVRALRRFGMVSPGVAEKGTRAMLNLSYHTGNVDVMRGVGGIADLILGVGARHGGRCREWAVRLWLRL